MPGQAVRGGGPTMIRVSAFAGVSLLALALAAPAAAQTQTVGPGQVEEIIVTAQKREERLTDIGLAVSAIGAEALRTSRVAATADLVGQVPNVDVKENIPGAQAIVTVRGVGL